ncbi:Phosphatidate phosphatase APP1 [Nakaseomyces bracarensis]|uniref:Phosphatidate phosphatase APP1 n=1 Tax=Nakaseomyces bracarensis TaxID=273131 RepID=A0ABR4NXX9_9SACH
MRYTFKRYLPITKYRKIKSKILEKFLFKLRGGKRRGLIIRYRHTKKVLKRKMDENDSNSKRQKFYDLMKRTKDVYIPNLKNTIATRPQFLETALGDSSSDLSTTQFPLTMYIQHYPSYYTTNLLAGNGKRVYDIVLRLTMLEPGDATRRRNRLLLSLCKQYMKDSNDSNSMVNNLNDLPSTDSFDVESGFSQNTNIQCEYETLNERIKGFLSKRIPNVPLRITITGSEPDQRDEIELKTDNIGYVETSCLTSFEPNSVKIKVETPSDFPHEVAKTIENLSYIKQDGWGLISDIDDTIKHTGVTGDKRSIFRNVFVHDFDRWKIDGMPTWYQTLRDVHKFDFFYVSNSPLQLFPVLSEFIVANYPLGPIFLKQYTGNFLSSLMTSSANRKLGKIRSILEDFPDKNFVLVGDSGEQDLEAYVNLACEFPKQIKAIFIRCCSNSLSDNPVNDPFVMRTINDLIMNYYLRRNSKERYLSRKNVTNDKNKPPLPARRPTVPLKKETIPIDSKLSKSVTDTDLINVADIKLKRRPPPIPTRKPHLTEEQESSIRVTRNIYGHDVQGHITTSKNDKGAPPTLPPRRTESTLYDSVCDKNSLSPSASTLTSSTSSSPTMSSGFFVPSSQNEVESVIQPTTDKKAENWEARVSTAINDLLASNTKVHFAFFTKPELCLEDTISLLNDEQKVNGDEKA